MQRIGQVGIVAQMLLRAVRSGDIPAAPALVEGRAVIGHVSAAVGGALFRRGMYGADQQPRNSQRHRTLMAAQAVLAAAESGLLALLDIQAVKINALFRI